MEDEGPRLAKPRKFGKAKRRTVLTESALEAGHNDDLLLSAPLAKHSKLHASGGLDEVGHRRGRTLEAAQQPVVEEVEEP